ncbi:MAG: helix-turn-helix domain-containing protein [Alphaproteobacteria bacterium]|nr:helix-turn-helix domain-containing protein [Alphaproteobacteria bacterium]
MANAAARALLNWSQDDLTRRAGIAKKTLADFERGATVPRVQTRERIEYALSEAGIELLNHRRPGVRLRHR